MVQFKYNDDSENPINSDRKSWNIQKRPDIIIGVIGFTAFIVIYGAIRVKKAGLSFASQTTIFSCPSLSATQAPHNVMGISDFLTRSANAVIYHSWFNNFINFFTKKIPLRLWNFYISAFLIGRYRKEWGIYQNWCFRSPQRPKQSKTKGLLSKTSTSKMTSLPTLSTESPTTCPLPPKKEEEEDDDLPKLPKPVPHNHAGCHRVRINVGGCIYETQTRTLNRYPHTLLGDPNKRLRFFNPSKQEYFFDRNRESFETILYYYQSGGRFKRPENVSADILLEDAKFYGLPQSVIYQYLCDEGLSIASEQEDILPENLFMRKIWLLFDYPQSSMQAQILSLISILAITLSITTFCIETMDVFVGRYRYFLNTQTGRAFKAVDGQGLDPADPFFFTETICSIWFIVEYIARLVSSPVKIDFLTNTLNIIDLIAVLPYFGQVLIPPDTEITDDHTKQTVLRNRKPTGSVSVIRVVRLVRVFRIFKLSRHSRGLKILGKTLQASLNELVLLIFFVMIGVVLFSSTMYFAELGVPGTHFPSIPDGFWWALITITTVGYGDNVPKSAGGKIVGALCAVAGVLTLALPVPVIVSNFNFFYHQALGESDLSWIKISHTPPCPFRPIDATTVDPTENANNSENGINKQRKRKSASSNKRLEKLQNPFQNYSSDEEFEMLKFENKMKVK